MKNSQNGCNFGDKEMSFWPKFSIFEKKFRHLAIYRQQKKRLDPRLQLQPLMETRVYKSRSSISWHCCQTPSLPSQAQPVREFILGIFD
jgi:hypothetical protein